MIFRPDYPGVNVWQRLSNNYWVRIAGLILTGLMIILRATGERHWTLLIEAAWFGIGWAYVVKFRGVTLDWKQILLRWIDTLVITLPAVIVIGVLLDLDIGLQTMDIVIGVIRIWLLGRLVETAMRQENSGTSSLAK